VNGPVLALNVLLVVLSDAAFALLVGCLLAAHWLDAAALKHSSRMLRRLCLACVAAMILNHLVRPWFAGASMSGSSSFAGNLALIPDILSSTHLGKLWYINSAVLVALLAATLLAARETRPVVAWPFVVCLFLIAGTKASSGHAGNGGDFTLDEFSMFVHVLGTAVWAGTVVASGLLVIPHLAEFPDPKALWSYGNLLSRTVTWALLAIFVSAVYTSDRELNGALSGLWRSVWGKILMTKIAFVSLALVLGACTRFQCVQRSATSRRAALMVRLMRVEALVMIVVLALSGTLANTPPAMTEAANKTRQSCLLYPRPRITWPGVAPVCWPLSITSAPFTMTYSIPSG
jgi:putative copper resistance protein D